MPRDPEIDRQLHALFDAHDEAIRALRSANAAMGTAIQAHDESISGMRSANALMGTAIQAHDDAIQAALHANRAAIELLDRLTENGGAGSSDT